MRVEIQKLPKSKIKLYLRIEGEEFSPYLVLAAKDLSKNIQIGGFRPGEVPPKILMEHIGKAQVLEKAAEIALNKLFPKIIEEKKLEVLGKGKATIDELSEEVFATSIEIAIMPEVKLPLWRKIAREEKRREVEVSDKEVEESLKFLQKSRAKYKRSFEAVKEGDQVEIDYEIRFNGVKIENGDIKGQKIIVGEGKLIPGFEENLIGMRENEEKVFSLTAPSTFWKKEFQGKVLEFKVKVKAIFKVELPEINDEFARSLGKFKDLSDLKRSIKEGIKIEKEKEEEVRWQNAVLEKLAQKAEIELPDILVEQERDRMLEDLKQGIEEMGLSFEIYLSHLGKKLDELKEDLKKEAEKRVKVYLCLYEIARQENIKVEDFEVKEEINRLLRINPMLVEELKDKEKEKRIIEYLREKILQQKVIDLFRKENQKASF